MVTTKEIYQQLITDTIQIPTAIEKLTNIFPFMESVDLSKIFSLPYNIIKEPYFQNFQLFIWKKNRQQHLLILPTY